MNAISQGHHGDNQVSNLKGLSEKEKQEIADEINQLTSQNRLKVTDELFEITPSKREGTLPLLINIMGIITIVISFYFTNKYFQEQEQNMAIENSTYESTEGGIIEELKRQSEEKLNTKQDEISQMQKELTKLNLETISIKDNMDNQIRDKEIEMRSEMEATLAEERKRLQSQGISTDELEKQLEAFKVAKEIDFAAKIAKFKTQTEATIKAKEAELLESKRITENILQQANQDMITIKENIQKRENDLQEQLKAEKDALTGKISEANQNLQKLAELQKKEQFIQDQLEGSYNLIIKNIGTGNYQVATENINGIRNLLSDPNISKIPSIIKRKNRELYFLDSLEKEIEQASIVDTTDYASMTSVASVLLSARENIELGVTAERKGNILNAQHFYNEALKVLPQVAKGVEYLRTIDNNEWAEKSKVSANTIATLTSKIKRSTVTIKNLEEEATKATEKADLLEKELNDAVAQIVEMIN